MGAHVSTCQHCWVRWQGSGTTADTQADCCLCAHLNCLVARRRKKGLTLRGHICPGPLKQMDSYAAGWHTRERARCLFAPGRSELVSGRGNASSRSGGNDAEEQRHCPGCRTAWVREHGALVSHPSSKFSLARSVAIFTTLSAEGIPALLAFRQVVLVSAGSELTARADQSKHSILPTSERCSETFCGRATAEWRSM